MTITVPVGRLAEFRYIDASSGEELSELFFLPGRSANDFPRRCFPFLWHDLVARKTGA